jgi:RNA polymerase sigma-70 factor (ECF subfamily)
MSVAADPFEDQLLPLLGSAYNTALRLTRNPADAEDLVQQAALLASRGFRSFQTGTNFKAWFFRILTNAYFSNYRQERRRGPSVSLEDTPELFLFGQAASLGLLGQSEDPAGDLVGKLDAEQVTTAMDSLPEKYRVVATLYFINDLTYEDIASALEIPIGTVRSRLHRGRRMLQRALWRLAQDHGIGQ